MATLADIERTLAAFDPSAAHDAWALAACRQALLAARQNTYGVGAVLVDPTGRVIVEGHNHVHVDGFHSDLHAEMVVMNEFERDLAGPVDLSKHTMVTSLEPCPMCMTRLIYAGVGTILHVAGDALGGMVSRREALPPIFRDITARQNQVWAPADCSEELREAALQIWSTVRADVDESTFTR
ncbi:MAG: nucleoside deaminase [Planctomycetota bacterium]